MSADREERWAEAFVERLVSTGGLELVSKSSRADVVEEIAALLAEDAGDASSLADRIVDLDGVAELTADDDAIASALAETEPADAPSSKRDAKPKAPVKAKAKAQPAPGPKARAAGPLATTATFKRAFTLAAAVGRTRNERWVSKPTREGWLRAEDVVRAERELETTLPDDFWAAAAAQLPAFAELGVAAQGAHGDPAPALEVPETVVENATDAELDDDLVPIVEQRICVKKKVAWAERNEQPVYLDGEERASFAEALLELLEGSFAEAAAKAPTGVAPAYTAKLV